MPKITRKLPPMGENRSADVAKAALGMLVVGLSAGIALIAGAKAVGDKLSEGRRQSLPEPEDDEKTEE